MPYICAHALYLVENIQCIYPTMFVLSPPPRWKRASHTLKKMSEPFRLHSKCIWVPYKPFLPITSSKQPTPRGETSSSSSLKHWKNRNLTWSHTSPTSEGKSLPTTKRTLSRLSLHLLVLLPWRHLPLLKKNQCQVHGSHTIELHTHTMHEALHRVHCGCHLLHMLGAVLSRSLVPVVHTHHAHKPHGAGVPTLCTYHTPRPDEWHCTVHGSCIVTIRTRKPLNVHSLTEHLHSTSLSTGPTLVSATGSSSRDSSHYSHFAEGKCTHVRAPRHRLSLGLQRAGTSCRECVNCATYNNAITLT